MEDLKFRCYIYVDRIFTYSDEFSDLEDFFREVLLLGQVTNIELQMCSGLRDKNGVEIYEGDIVTHNGFEFNEVVWKDAAFQVNYVKDGLTNDNHYFLANLNLDMYEVVGNVCKTSIEELERMNNL